MEKKRHEKHGLSLAAKVIVAVAAGAALGAWAGQSPVILGAGTEELGRLGMLVIRALKALAVPLVFLTIVDAILSYEVRRGMLGRLAAACLVNACVPSRSGFCSSTGSSQDDGWRHTSATWSPPRRSEGLRGLLGDMVVAIVVDGRAGASPAREGYVAASASQVSIAARPTCAPVKP